MVLTPLECITRCSSSTSSPRGGTGIGSGRRVNDGDVSHNEATREDGEVVTAVFAVGWGITGWNNCVLYIISHALCGRGQFWIRAFMCMGGPEWVERGTFVFHKRVYANDHLWLEGSFGTRSCCLAVLRGYDACYISGIQVIIVTQKVFAKLGLVFGFSGFVNRNV
jgi:hypothetical protein